MRKNLKEPALPTSSLFSPATHSKTYGAGTSTKKYEDFASPPSNRRKTLKISSNEAPLSEAPDEASSTSTLSKRRVLRQDLEPIKIDPKALISVIEGLWDRMHSMCDVIQATREACIKSRFRTCTEVTGPT